MANDSFMYEGVMGINLGMFGYMGPIDVFPTFCPEPIKGPKNDPKGGKLAIMALVYNGFWDIVRTSSNPYCV